MDEASCARAAHPFQHTHWETPPRKQVPHQRLRESDPVRVAGGAAGAGGDRRLLGSSDGPRGEGEGGLGVARRRWVDGDGGMYEDGPASPVCISESDVFGILMPLRRFKTMIKTNFKEEEKKKRA